MQHDFYLAWRYLVHHRIRSLILVSSLSLLAVLPLALHLVLDEGERQLSLRAAQTPLLVGAKGSAVDLTLNALYFSIAAAPVIPMVEVNSIQESGLADALPIYTRFRIQGHPLVGATLDYHDFRGLSIRTGRMMGMLGECILGVDAAQDLKLKPGDTLLTTPENLFDLAGVYPLRLHVSGVLARSHSPDDQAIFIDLQTAWVMEGLGHGHAESKASVQAINPLIAEDVRARVADAGLVTYTEITPENLDAFHFHGDAGNYPVSAIIVIPHDRKSAALLRGRYVADDAATQIVQPLKTITGLLENIFRIRRLFDSALLLVGIATFCIVGLVFALTLRLRESEINAIYLLGCSRGKVVRLLFAEAVLLSLACATVCVVLMAVVRANIAPLVRFLVLP
ncbi:hypothetical protein RP726_15135 [Candidatus Methylospira mobilis]|uniref:hypothetical protein n=1 Tax=Candidatus Methylospira mobilis TaxID=1808979 RepID=UPI0028E37EC3|nr:hypothetical protein [Candidatus Methylospira mobilis]WNV03759.1 hypothetical protein RP726_15135 [Candidatus Methylospira mobilis]